MSDLLTAALDYATAGLPVFPLKPCGKTPLTARGFHEASADVQKVAAWWDRWPDANIGIRTGADSGLVVLDVDTPHGGAGTLKELEQQHGKLPRTAQTLTGGGGHHYLFAHPGREVRNSAGTLGAGLDTRGAGGYIVAPPSLHESGRPYKWVRTLEQALPAEPPAWLLDGSRNGSAPLVGSTIPKGERNATLTSLAGTMRRRGMDELAICAALLETNRTRCEPPLPDRDVERIAHSIARYAPDAGDAAKTRADAEIASAFARARRRRTLGVASVGTTAVSDRLTLRNLDSYRIRQVEWLDKPVLQRSAFHLLAGRKGTCKGTWTCWLAARVTRGDLYEQPKRVLVVTSEDSVELDFLPRLVAAGGDRTMVEIVNGPFRMPADLEWLKKKALDVADVGLIVIDPIGNHLGGADTDKEGLVREAIAPLNEIADELDCMILGIRHLGKNSSRGALASVLGSTAWVDVPRAVILMAADDEDNRLYHAQVVAGNRGPRNSGRAFRLELVDAPPAKEITLLVPEGMSSKDVEDLLGARVGNGAPQSGSAKATELILDILENEGEQESDALDARIAKETGISAKTARNVRSKLNTDGLIRSHPDRDEHGAVTAWRVRRSNAPRTDA